MCITGSVSDICVNHKQLEDCFLRGALADNLRPLPGHERVAGRGRVDAVFPPVRRGGSSGDSSIEHRLEVDDGCTELLRQLAQQ